MHRQVCTDKSLHRGDFAHKVFTHKRRLRAEELYTQKLLHAEAFLHRVDFTQRSLYTEKS